MLEETIRNKRSDNTMEDAINQVDSQIMQVNNDLEATRNEIAQISHKINHYE